MIRENEKKNEGGQRASQINGQRIYLMKKQIYALPKRSGIYTQPEPRCQREKDSSPVSWILPFLSVLSLLKQKAANK